MKPAAPLRIPSVLVSMPLLLAALVVCGCGGPAQPAREDDSTLVARLTAQADRWDKAIVRKDRTAIEENMADDFRQIHALERVASQCS